VVGACGGQPRSGPSVDQAFAACQPRPVPNSANRINFVPAAETRRPKAPTSPSLGVPICALLNHTTTPPNALASRSCRFLLFLRAYNHGSDGPDIALTGTRQPQQQQRRRERGGVECAWKHSAPAAAAGGGRTKHPGRRKESAAPPARAGCRIRNKGREESQQQAHTASLNRRRPTKYRREAVTTAAPAPELPAPANNSPRTAASCRQLASPEPGIVQKVQPPPNPPASPSPTPSPPSRRVRPSPRPILACAGLPTQAVSPRWPSRRVSSYRISHHTAHPRPA
jgi:hypothetical protein